MRVRGSDRGLACVLPEGSDVTGFDAFLSSPAVVQANWVGAEVGTPCRLRIYDVGTTSIYFSTGVTIADEADMFDLGEDWPSGDTLDVSLQVQDSCGEWRDIASDWIPT